MVEWFDIVELATHGEVLDNQLTRCYREKRTHEMLVDDSKADRRGRELFAAYFLIPLFNHGVRDLSDRTNEQVNVDPDELMPTEA